MITVKTVRETVAEKYPYVWDVFRFLLALVEPFLFLGLVASLDSAKNTFFLQSPALPSTTGTWVFFSCCGVPALLILKILLIHLTDFRRFAALRGLVRCIAAADCLLIMAPAAGHFGLVWAVLWSVFGGYLLLSGAVSLTSFGKRKIQSRRESQRAELDALLAGLRETLAGEGQR